MQARKLKSCPVCGTRLDSDTWSHCKTCGWDRPMPYDLPAEMRAPAAAVSTSTTETGPPPDKPHAIRWYVKVFAVQLTLFFAGTTVAFPFVSLPLFGNVPWQNWAFKSIAAAMLAGFTWILALRANLVVRDAAEPPATPKALLYGKGSIILIGGTATPLVLLSLNLPFGLAGRVLIVFLGCYLALMGLCMLLWAAKGPTRPKNA